MASHILEFRSRYAAGKSVVLQPAFTEGQLLVAKQHNLMEQDVVLGSILHPVDPPTLARINAAFLPGRFGWKGRWIADCGMPLDDNNVCTGAEMVDFRIPVFMCCNCFNRLVDHQWRKITLPEPRERVAIERALLRRKERNLHNYEPSYETYEDLLEQNHLLGIESEVAP